VSKCRLIIVFVDKVALYFHQIIVKGQENRNGIKIDVLLSKKGIDGNILSKKMTTWKLILVNKCFLSIYTNHKKISFVSRAFKNIKD